MALEGRRMKFSNTSIIHRFDGRFPVRDRCAGGFALILAMVLMGFMFMLLVSLGMLTRVNLASTDIDQQRTTARANAKMALREALGQLQGAAGPDQRVTATSDAVGMGQGREHWTGVWRTDTADIEQWLVSNGGTFDNATESEGTITFLSNLDAQDQVRVPRVSLPDGMGGYGWWISDEGVKARINVLDPYRELAAVDTESAEELSDEQIEAMARQRYRMAVSQETGAALLLGAAQVARSLDPAVDDDRDFLERICTLNQMDLYPAVDGQESLLSADNLVHDVTVQSMGVLADVRAGGLKHDLTAAFDSGETAPPGFPAAWWNRLKSYYASTGQAALTAQVDTTGVSQSYFPVLVKTNFQLTLFKGPAETGGDIPHWAEGRKLYIGLGVAFSLHNPYNAELTLPEGFVVEVILPAEANPADDTSNAVNHLRVASRRSRDGSVRTEEDFDTTLVNSGLSRFYFRLKMDQSVTFAPGQTRLFSIDNSGGDQDITSSSNTAEVAKIRTAANGRPGFLFKQVVIR
ncbi:MAG: hypothetical protein ACQKBW_05235, partial [Puniceicoccales bacterium]